MWKEEKEFVKIERRLKAHNASFPANTPHDTSICDASECDQPKVSPAPKDAAACGHPQGSPAQTDASACDQPHESRQPKDTPACDEQH